jgi:hypothetical protein
MTKNTSILKNKFKLSKRIDNYRKLSSKSNIQAKTNKKLYMYTRLEKKYRYTRTPPRTTLNDLELEKSRFHNQN